ncbi:unnamed protein product, partial [Prorocentrum cordatum]
GLIQAGEGIGSSNLAKIMESWMSLEAATWQKLCEIVRLCKVQKTYQSDQRRLSLCLAEGNRDLRAALVFELAQ